MSRIHGLLDPEARAAIVRCSPSWPRRACAIPRTKHRAWTAGPARTRCGLMRARRGQRNHDALKAMGRSVLASGELGRHNGLLNCPATKRIKSTRRSPKRSRSTSGTPATREHGGYGAARRAGCVGIGSHSVR
jgi:hypothetical protein